MTPYTAICGHSRWCHLQANTLCPSLLSPHTACHTAEDPPTNSQRELDELGFKNEQDVIQQAHDEGCISCSRHVTVSGILTNTCKIKDNLFMVRFARSAVGLIVMAVV
jgi:hypothetical protein